MYGLLLQSAVDQLKSKYGEEAWEKIRKEANISMNGFATHNIYSEHIMVDLATAAAKVTGDTLDTIMDSFGVEFVNFVSQFGYDRILKVLGRHMRDFLNGLDNLHEYLRFSYPKLKPPSFFVEDETKNGLTITYRSRRRGFLHYVKGQIRQVGKVFYNTRVDIFMVANDYNEATQTTHVKFRLLFDNKAFRELSSHMVDNIVDSIPLRPELLFELFPFHIVFSRKMEIRSVGPGLRAVLPMSVGKNLVDFFNLERPLTNFTWEDILHHTNNVFQLVGKKHSVQTNHVTEEATSQGNSEVNMNSEQPNEQASHPPEPHPETMNNSVLHLKGQMMYMHEWDCIMFLGTPIMSSLDDMFKIGLYINDLSMHDSSRDLVLAGTQQSAELKLALDQEQEKSRLLEQSMIKLDQEMQRTDALLYQMIPKPVADRLRKGVPSVETCQVFDNVTILFSDVVGFTTICSQITPMEVVSMLNSMYTQFDQLSEQHSVYKVETIGDAYMAVSGAPIVTKYHGLHMCDMALDMRSSMSSLINPSNNETMKIRIGVHTGTTVAGVVGMKMPRYCLFGDTVNTASRMETSGESMKIHISETTRKELEGYPYEVEERGSIEVKGKGQMKTYWLIGKKTMKGQDLSTCPFIAIMEEEVRSRNRDEKTEYSTSRLNLDHAPVTSSSPIPYSPVVLDDRASPAGRKISRGSADGEAYRLAGGASPRGSKSGPPGCPFAMGLFGEPPAADSEKPTSAKQSPVKKKPNKQSPVKKKSDETASVQSRTSNTSDKAPAPATPTNQTQPTSKNMQPQPTPVARKNSAHTTSFTCPVSPGYAAPQSSIPKTAAFSTGSVQTSNNGLHTSHVPPKIGVANDSNTTDASIKSKLANTSSKNAIGNDKSHNPAPKVSISHVEDKKPDNDSLMTLNSRAASVATIQSNFNKQITHHDSHSNDEANHFIDSNVRNENGNAGNKQTSSKQHFDIYQSDKQSNLANGNHVIKTDVGCMSKAGCDKSKSNKTSKMCHVL